MVTRFRYDSGFVVIDLVNSKYLSACIVMINSLIGAGKKKREVFTFEEYLVTFA